MSRLHVGSFPKPVESKNYKYGKHTVLTDGLSNSQTRLTERPVNVDRYRGIFS